MPKPTPTTVRPPTSAAGMYDPDYGIYQPFERLLERAGFDQDGIKLVPVARKSDESEALAAEQATKHFGTVARDVPEVAELLAQHPVKTWSESAVRRQLGIVEVRVSDVMPERLDDDPHGTGVIGDLLIQNGVAYLVVAKSGFKSARNHRKEPVNPYTECVLQLIKVARRGNPGDLALRFAGDTTRKGRLLPELNRMDGHTEQLRLDVYFGSEKLDGGMARLIELIQNHQAAIDRTGGVTNLVCV